MSHDKVFVSPGLGGFLGPTVVGLLKQATGGYAAGMAALAVGLTVSATILLAMGQRQMPVPAAARSLP